MGIFLKDLDGGTFIDKMLKVYFIYSHPYDRTFCELLKVKRKEKEVKKLISSLNKKERYISRICKAIEKATGLMFKKDVKCYVVSDTLWKGFSDPLTIRLSNINEFINVLIHELIHVISVQNKNRMKILNKLIERRFNLPLHTRVHIWVNIADMKVKRAIGFKNFIKKKKVLKKNLKKRYKADLIKSYKIAREIAKKIEPQLPENNILKRFEMFLKKK